MPGSRTLANLNKALQMEISAAHQYQLHAHVLDDWGLTGLAQQMRKEMAEEIDHSDRFLARILVLKGNPEIAFAKPPERAPSLVEMFRSDLADEADALAFYTRAAREAEAEDDLGSRILFEQTAIAEEGHKAWLDLQLDLLDRIGEAAYSAMQVMPGADDGAA